jgi:NTE family protein
MSSSAETDGPACRPKVGVVVGSGGIKAMSSIPLFEFIEKEKITIDLLIGCSGGSIISALWALDRNATHMRTLARQLWKKEVFRKIDYNTLLSISGFPVNGYDKSHGLIKPDGVKRTYKEIFGDHRFEDLSTRLLMQSTDLLTGEPVILDSGTLWDAVYASSALFPILPPINRGGRWLIDGANSSPVPILQAVNCGMDVIIALSNEERSIDESDNFFSWFMRCMAYQSTWLTRNQLALSVNLHHHEIIFINTVFDKHFGLRDVTSIPAIIQAGQDSLDCKKGDILEAITNFQCRNYGQDNSEDRIY